MMTVSRAGTRVQRRDLLKLAGNMYLSPAIANDRIEKALAAADEFETLAVCLGSQKTGARAWAKRFTEIGADLVKTMVAVGAPDGPSRRSDGKSKRRTR